MNRIVGAIFLLTSPSLLAADADADVRKELEALQGTWKAVALEAGGNALPKEAVPEFTFIIGADGKATGKTAKSEYAATIAVNPKKDPKTIDNAHESGPQKGKKQYGVYKLEGDKLIVCITAPGRAETDRPRDFSTRDSANVLFIFERLKGEKQSPRR